MIDILYGLSSLLNPTKRINTRVWKRKRPRRKQTQICIHFYGLTKCKSSYLDILNLLILFLRKQTEKCLQLRRKDKTGLVMEDWKPEHILISDRKIILK